MLRINGKYYSIDAIWSYSSGKVFFMLEFGLGINGRQKITAGDLSGIKWIENFLQIMKSMFGGKGS